MRKYKTTGNTTLFDKEDTERKLTEMGDPLLTAEKHYLPVCVNFVLPASLTAIGEEAFAGLPAGTVVLVPENVTSIGDGAFGEGVLLVTPSGSYAAGWANRYGVRWVEPADQP